MLEEKNIGIVQHHTFKNWGKEENFGWNWQEKYSSCLVQHFHQSCSQPVFTCSKLTKETLE